jgi:hypothetical protein
MCLSLSVGCRQAKSVSDRGISSGNDQTGYMHADGESVMFIRWTEINNKLNGQLSVFYTKSARVKSTETSSHSFEGISDGKNISLNFNGSQWTDPLGGKAWTGTISGDELTLVIPSSNGTLAPVKFKAGNVEQYNQTVLGIKQSVNAENSSIQKEKAEAERIEAEKGAVAEGNNRVRSSLNALSNSTSQLEGSLKFDDVFRSYARTWEKMKADYKNLEDKAAEKPLTSYKLGTVQYLLGVLQYDLGTFESHSGTLDYKIARVNDASKSLRAAEKSVGTPGISCNEPWLAIPVEPQPHNSPKMKSPSLFGRPKQESKTLQSKSNKHRNGAHLTTLKQRTFTDKQNHSSRG